MLKGLLAFTDKNYPDIEHQIREKKFSFDVKDVVNIGIGGSDLGPQMLAQALKPFWKKKVRVHFIANIDPHQFDAVVEKLNPETTLFVVSSKSFLR